MSTHKQYSWLTALSLTPQVNNNFNHFSLNYGVKSKVVSQVKHVGTHCSFLFSIFSKNYGLQAVPISKDRPISHMCK